AIVLMFAVCAVLSATPLQLWTCPIGQPRCLQWALFLVEIHPLSLQIVQVAAKPKTRTCPLESLGLRCRAGVVVLRPFLAESSVCAQAVDRHLGRHHDLRRNGPFCRTAFLPFEVLDHL